MQEGGSSVDSRIRDDNNFILNFLTSTAAVLTDRGLMSPREVDSLRTMINGIQSAQGSREAPVLAQFADQGHEFLQFIEARFGVQGFSENLARRTLAAIFHEMRNRFIALGNDLLDKAKLFFNKEVPLYLEGAVERTVLFSTLGIDVAEAIGKCVTVVDSAISEVELMLPHTMAYPNAAEREIDLEIAAATGFRGVAANIFAGASGLLARSTAAAAMDNFACILAEVSNRLALPMDATKVTRLNLLAGSLKFEAQRFREISWGQSGALIDWEARRQGLLSHGKALVQLVGEICDEFLDVVGSTGFKNYAAGPTRAIARRIQFGLMQKGATGVHAARAASDLVNYLHHHKVGVEELIPGELRKIEGNFSIDALALIQDQEAAEAWRLEQNREKADCLARSERLKSIFSRVVQGTSHIAVFMSFFLLGSCGIKSSPQSDLKDLRPDVPFRGNSFYTAPSVGNDVRKAQEAAELPALPPNGK
jgi:hypothetical protein